MDKAKALRSKEYKDIFEFIDVIKKVFKKERIHLIGRFLKINSERETVYENCLCVQTFKRPYAIYFKEVEGRIIFDGIEEGDY